MQELLLDTSIAVYYVPAASFPDGVLEAHQNLHKLVAFNKDRKYFGISWPNKEGNIQYLAAANELIKGELAEHKLETFTIKNGYYIYIDIPNFMQDIAAIGKAFQILIANKDIDPNGQCIEWYTDQNTCRCMVRLNKEINNKTENKMTDTTKVNITVEAIVNAPIQKVWDAWTNPIHIKQWNNASPDWHTPNAENDLRVGGKFLSRMEAKDGSFGFDFWGIYDVVIENNCIAYTLGDGRKVKIDFSTVDDATKIVETFEAETENSIELQQSGWQAILNNFKAYTENM